MTDQPWSKERAAECIIAICGTFIPGGWAHPGDACVKLIGDAISHCIPHDDEQLYVISVTGDGGQTTIVPEGLLKSELHKAYCSCGKDWQKCSDEDITNTIAKLDDAEEWTQDYPTYERHIWFDKGEDYTVQVMRVSAIASPTEKSNAVEVTSHLVHACCVCGREHDQLTVVGPGLYKCPACLFARVETLPDQVVGTAVATRKSETVEVLFQEAQQVGCEHCGSMLHSSTEHQYE